MWRDPRQARAPNSPPWELWPLHAEARGYPPAPYATMNAFFPGDCPWRARGSQMCDPRSGQERGEYPSYAQAQFRKPRHPCAEIPWGGRAHAEGLRRSSWRQENEFPVPSFGEVGEMCQRRQPFQVTVDVNCRFEGRQDAVLPRPIRVNANCNMRFRDVWDIAVRADCFLHASGFLLDGIVEVSRYSGEAPFARRLEDFVDDVGSETDNSAFTNCVFIVHNRGKKQLGRDSRHKPRAPMRTFTGREGISPSEMVEQNSHIVPEPSNSKTPQPHRLADSRFARHPMASPRASLDTKDTANQGTVQSNWQPRAPPRMQEFPTDRSTMGSTRESLRRSISASHLPRDATPFPEMRHSRGPAVLESVYDGLDMFDTGSRRYPAPHFEPSSPWPLQDFGACDPAMFSHDLFGRFPGNFRMVAPHPPGEVLFPDGPFPAHTPYWGFL